MKGMHPVLDEGMAMDGFLMMMEELKDPRNGNAQRYSLAELLFAAFGAMLCGAQNCVDMGDFAQAKLEFLRERLPYEHGAPSHDTFSRLFRALDSDAFEKWFTRFMVAFAEVEPDGDVYAVDGKTARRSHDAAAERTPLHMVNVWSSDQRVVLAQHAVDGTSNEIPAVREVLEMLALEGATVTLDALHCQRETAEVIVAGGGDYLVAAKGNQHALHEDLLWFWKHAPSDGSIDRDCTVEKDHGRIETRTARSTTAVEWIQQGHHWPHLRCLVEITREREVIGKDPTVETVRYLSSRVLSAAEANRLARTHWEVENCLHWVLDVAFDEDRSRVRKDHGPANLAILRKLAFNAIKREPSKMGVQRKRNVAGWDHQFLLKLIRHVG